MNRVIPTFLLTFYGISKTHVMISIGTKDYLLSTFLILMMIVCFVVV